VDASTDLQALPPQLPVPVDDGACEHLPGSPVPAIRLQSTGGRPVDLAALEGTWVLYAFPRIASPGRAIPAGWDDIPGARGCTPQSCRYRDVYAEFVRAGVSVFGVSTQDPAEQREAVRRLQLPFELLSDDQLELAHGWALPTFTVEGEVLLCRFTLVIRNRAVAKVIYPVFPPTTNADDVLRFLNAGR
jgi:peroxiredoxin